MIIQKARQQTGREVRSKTIELGSHRDAREAPESAVPESTVPAAQAGRALGRQRNAVLVGIGLAAAANGLRNHGFNGWLIMLGLVARSAWKVLAWALVRFIAWQTA